MNLSENNTEQEAGDSQTQAAKKAKIWDILRRRMDRSAVESISMRVFYKRAKAFITGMFPI
jgi:hypothetical protein